MYRCWGHGQVKPQCDEKKLHYSFQWAKKEPVFFLMKNRVWNSHRQDYRACIFHSAGELLSTLLLCLRGIMWLWAEICWNVKTLLWHKLCGFIFLCCSPLQCVCWQSILQICGINWSCCLHSPETLWLTQMGRPPPEMPHQWHLHPPGFDQLLVQLDLCLPGSAASHSTPPEAKEYTVRIF